MWSKGRKEPGRSNRGEPGAGRPLAGTERAFYAVSRLSPLNLVVLVRLAGPALEDVLPAALAALQRRHPWLRARLAGPPSRPCFDVSPPESAAGGMRPLPLRWVDSTDPDAAFAVAEQEMSTPFEPARGPLARVTCVRGAGPASDLVLTLHHVIADGASAANLVHELLGSCQARLAGLPAPAPGPAAMPPPLTDVLPPILRGPRGRLRALALVARQGRDEIAYRRGSRGRRPIPPSGRALTKPLRLDRASTDALVSQARRHRLTTTSVLSAALLWQASTVLYSALPCTMRAVVWVDLRPHLAPPVEGETLGCYVSMLRFVIRVDPLRGFAVLAAEVQDRLERAARRGDRIPAALLSGGLARAAVRWPATRLGTIALSYAAAPAIQPSYGPLGVREVQAFVSNLPLGAEIAAAAGPAPGGLWCNLLYLDTDFGEKTAAAIGDGLLSTLLEFTNA